MSFDLFLSANKWHLINCLGCTRQPRRELTNSNNTRIGMHLQGVCERVWPKFESTEGEWSLDRANDLTGGGVVVSRGRADDYRPYDRIRTVRARAGVFALSTTWLVSTDLLDIFAIQWFTKTELPPPPSVMRRHLLPKLITNISQSQFETSIAPLLVTKLKGQPKTYLKPNRVSKCWRPWLLPDTDTDTLGVTAYFHITYCITLLIFDASPFPDWEDAA